MSGFGWSDDDFNDDWIDQHMNAVHERVREVNNMLNTVMSNSFGMLEPPNHGAPPSNALTDGRLQAGAHARGLSRIPAMPTMPDFPPLPNAPGTSSFCSRAVYRMSSGNGQPQVYKAAMSTQMGPDGVRETRKMMQDSVHGVKKMAIEKQIGDRARIIAKQQNLKSGELQEHEELVNLDEEEAEQFDREFAKKLRATRSPFAGTMMPREIKSAKLPTRSTPKSLHPSQTIADLPSVTGKAINTDYDASHKFSAHSKPSRASISSGRFSPPSQVRDTAAASQEKSPKQSTKKPQSAKKSPTIAKRASKK